MSNELALRAELNQLPSTQLGTDDAFLDLAKGSDFPGRLKLFTKGKAIDRGLIRPGHYGIEEGKDEIHDLGDAIDVMVYARRVKAVDFRDKDAIQVSYDSTSPEFKRVVEASAGEDSKCLYGISFLVYERSTSRMLELYFCSPSARPEANKLYPFMPVTQGQIDAKAAAGIDTTGLVASDARPVTLKARLVEKPTFSWHVPVAIKCSTPFAKLPKPEKLIDEITRFLNPKQEEAERDESTNERAR